MPKYKTDVANALHKIALHQPGGLETHNITDAIQSANGDAAVLEEIGAEVLSRIGSQQELQAALVNIPQLQQIPALQDPEIIAAQAEQQMVEEFGENPIMTPPTPNRRRIEVDKQIKGLQQRLQDGFEHDPETYWRKFNGLMKERATAIAEDQAEKDEFDARVQKMQNRAAELGIGVVHASRAAHRRSVQKLVDAGLVTDGSLITDDAALADPTRLVETVAALKQHQESQLDPASKAMKGAKNKEDLRRIVRNTPGIVVEGGGGIEGGQGAH